MNPLLTMFTGGGEMNFDKLSESMNMLKELPAIVEKVKENLPKLNEYVDATFEKKEGEIISYNFMVTGKKIFMYVQKHRQEKGKIITEELKKFDLFKELDKFLQLIPQDAPKQIEDKK